MNRQSRKAIAQETLEILDKGGYIAPSGRQVSIEEALDESVEGTELIRPEDWQGVKRAAAEAPPSAQGTHIEVTPEKTLAAARRLKDDDTDRPVLALNFAAGRIPGGGFLSGARAQEETLARASGLYRCQNAQFGYYEANRAIDSRLYTDHAIHSPGVPVFRDDDCRLLETPYTLGILTMPAPNANGMSPDNPDRARVPEVFDRRRDDVIALAITRAYPVLILGAWGCGAFGNDAEMVAGAFARALEKHADRIPRIVFAVFDHRPGQPVYRVFQRTFA